MSRPVPDWVSFDAVKTTGLDLLGLRAPVQQISNELFNGLTTITPKLRYLSVISWILWRYSQAGLPDKKASFMEFAAAQEAAIVMANRFRDRTTTSLVGVTEADNALDSGKGRLPLKKLAQNIAFNAYISSTRQLHMTKQTASGFNGLIKERGVPLAKEFDKIIQKSSYGSRLTKKPRLDSILRADLEELSADVSLETIPRGERDILIGILLPTEPVDPPEKRRLANYALLLWLSSAKQGFVEEGDVFEAARELPQGLPDCLVEVANGWLEYLVRDVLAVTHEAVFGAVMREVDVMSAERQSPSISAEVLAALLADPTEKDEVLRDLHILKAGESVSTVSFRTVFERVRRLCRKEETVSHGVRRWQGGLSETAIYDLALQSHVVVRATVTSGGAEYVNGSVSTHYQLSVTDVWKGAVSGRQLDVYVPGGRAGGFRELVPGAPVMNTGSEYVVFLWLGKSGRAQIIGLSQGLFNVTKDSSGAMVLERAGAKETMIDPATGRSVTDETVRMKASDLKALVKKRQGAI